MKPYYIAIDLGAESGRVMLGKLTPDSISLAEVHRFPNLQIAVPLPNGQSRLHWDVLRLFQEIKVGLAKVADAHDPASIAGIGVDTWGVDFGLVDGRGELIGNPVCYRDARTHGVVEQVFAKMPREKIYAATGIQTMPINTLFQLASLAFGKSPQLSAARHVLFMPDLLTYWLSGVMSTEYTFASTSQMLDARSRDWSPEILAVLGLPRDLFPPLVMPGTRESVRGPVLAVANEKLAAAGVPVIAVGSHDTASAVVAVPAEAGDDWLYLSSGTWSLVGAEVPQPVLSEKAMAYNLTNEGGVAGTIRLLKNISGMYLLQECRKEWARDGREIDYATLTRLAEEAGPGEALLDLEQPEFSTPGNMLGKIAAFCRRTNRSAPETPGQFARVILESLAANYTRMKGMLEEVTGRTYRTLHIVGGGGQNALLNQLAANATGMRVLAGPVEATALGNVATQAISTGAMKSVAEARGLIRRCMQVQSYLPA